MKNDSSRGGCSMAAKKMTLNESFEKLNEILEEMENEEVSLEASFSLYQEGMKLLKQCNDSIDKVEKELMVLEEEGIPS